MTARVLVVDDDLALLEALPETLRLRMPDVAVETCDSAAAALERIVATDYDAIVTDIKMPGMDGLALLAQIRVLRPDTPTLFITGHGEHDLAVQSLRGGAYDYVQKPVDRDYFVATLGRAIQVRQLHRQVTTQQQALERHAQELETVVAVRTRELRETAERVRALTEVATAIHAAQGVEEVLRTVVGAACRLAGTGIAVAGCFRGPDDAGALADARQWEITVLPREMIHRTDRGQIARLFAHVCKARKAVRIGDASADPMWRNFPPGGGRPPGNGASREGDGQGAPVRIASILAMPIHGRSGKVLGAIILGDPAPARLTEDVEVQIQALARQAAIALENALLYEHERGIAETLQRSLLPERLPEFPGVAMGARYLPGSHEAVGGDWYDAFTLPTGQIALVMGDVAGRGIWAAAVMGQLRNALRAYAHEGLPPATIAERLNRLIDPEAMATLLYMVFDPDTWTVRYVNQGHLPPLVLTPAGETQFLPGGGPPLGTPQALTYHEEFTALQPGATVVLYTDGLVEVRGEAIDAGLGRLEQVIGRTASLEVRDQVDRVLAEMLGARPAGDDIAVLALRTTPLDPGRLELRLPAVPTSLPQLRRILRRWLDAAGVQGDDAYEIITACHEACANAVEHAYGPADQTFALNATMTEEGIVIHIQDAGQWRAPHGPRRGHGLKLMEALMDTVDIASGSQGTLVKMRRRVDGGVRV